MPTYPALDPNGYPDRDVTLTSVVRAATGSLTTPVAETLWIAPCDFTLDTFQANWTTAGGAGTIVIEKLGDTTALGSGTVITGAIDITGTALTTYNATNTAIAEATRRVTKGQRLALKFASGNGASCVGLVVTISGRTWKIG